MLSDFSLACPTCHTLLLADDANCLRCPVDNQAYQCIDGIWRMLSPERTEHFARFMEDYEAIRQAEGRGGYDASYYQLLPYAVADRWSGDWAIRARSFETLVERVIAPPYQSTALSILDLGAGNGWLSNRLVERGHRVAAVDLQTNTFDGLGAFIHYQHPFLPVPAEFDHVPFEASTVDFVIFNAWLHDSEDYAITLLEALRVMRTDGQIVILDTPVYRDAVSGQRMTAERQQHFRREYGFASDALASEHYLTHDRLKLLGDALGIVWQPHRPHYGWRWVLRRLVGRIRTRREPAEFYVIAGKRA